MLYDTQTLNEETLGEGGYTRFSPGGTWLGWIAFTNPPSVMEGELHVIELASGDERTVGTARSLRWLDDERVIAHVRGNEMAVIDVVTGAYSDPGSLNLNSDPFAEHASGVRLEDMTPEVTGAPPPGAASTASRSPMELNWTSRRTVPGWLPTEWWHSRWRLKTRRLT